MSVESCAAPAGATGAALGRLHVPKASDVLADDLRERILGGELLEGTVLPPARTLATQTRLSRATVHEALRVLEIQGLVVIRPGRAGGVYVVRPSADAVVSSVTLLVRGRHLGLRTLLETRASIEPTCAALAARERTAADMRLLESATVALSASEELDDFLAANLQWHVAVAVASRNELLLGLMHALSRSIYATPGNAGFVHADVRRTTARAHQRITDAIRDGDVTTAGRRMGRHLQAYVDGVRAEDEVLDWADGPSEQ